MTETKKPAKNPEPIDQTIMRFCSKFTGVPKTRENTHTRSLYFTIDDVWKAARPILEDVGLFPTYRVSIDRETGNHVLTLTLTNRDGESTSSEMYLTPEKQTPQGLGSAMTYFRRYLLVSALHITDAMDDDDGNDASAPPTLTEEQQVKIAGKAEELFGDDGEKVVGSMVRRVYQKKSLKEIPADLCDDAISRLQKKFEREQKKGATKTEERDEQQQQKE